MRVRQVVAGVLIFAAAFIPPLADYTYPITWWGLLLIVDAWNERRRGLSLWRGRLKHFLLITIPVSVLFWLLFEILNLAAPQWRYKGSLTDLSFQVLFGFVAFATVIPIMVESYWLVDGKFCVPEGFAGWFRSRRLVSIIIGMLFVTVPFFNAVFWFNQGIWLAPALVLLPFTDPGWCAHARRFVAALAASGLLAGFFWELFNYRARTHWEYLILPGAPHLFQMPLPGYIGFIPFALTALVVYERQLRLPARMATSALLYVAALGGLYVLTSIYVHRGLWLFN